VTQRRAAELAEIKALLMAALAIAELLASDIRKREILVPPAIPNVTANIKPGPVDPIRNRRQCLDRHVRRLCCTSKWKSRERCHQHPAPDTHTHTQPSYKPRGVPSAPPVGKGVLTHANQKDCVRRATLNTNFQNALAFSVDNASAKSRYSLVPQSFINRYLKTTFASEGGREKMIPL
jgi:hypothetical protein